MDNNDSENDRDMAIDTDMDMDMDMVSRVCLRAGNLFSCRLLIVSRRWKWKRTADKTSSTGLHSCLADQSAKLQIKTK